MRFENKNTFFYFEKNCLAYYSAGVVVVNSKSWDSMDCVQKPGANPTIASWFYNAAGSLARFENKTTLFYFWKTV
jgi:homospermidine synthase